MDKILQMPLRPIALLLVAFSAAFSAYTFYNKPPSPVEILDDCRRTKNAPATVIQACTELLTLQDISDERRHYILSVRGWAYRQNGQYENAVADLDRALEIQPTNIHTRVDLAKFNAFNGDLDAAERGFEMALELDPLNVRTLRKRAEIFMCNGEVEKATQDYKRVLQLEHLDETKIIDNLIVISLIQEDYDLAIERLKQAILIFPDTRASTLELLGVLYYHHSNDYELALQTFLELAENYPTYSEPQLYVGATYLKLGDENLGHKYIDLYVKSVLQKSKAKDNLYDRGAAWIGKWMYPKFSLETYVRGLAYGTIDQRDRARLELTAFLENGQRMSATILSGSFERDGIPFNESWVTEIDDEFYIALDKHLDRFDYDFSLQKVKTVMREACNQI